MDEFVKRRRTFARTGPAPTMAINHFKDIRSPRVGVVESMLSFFSDFEFTTRADLRHSCTFYFRVTFARNGKPWGLMQPMF